MVAESARLTRRFAAVAGRAVHYRYGGAGAPVLLLHEAPGSSAALAPLLDRLVHTLTVLAPDLPGCGGSDDAEASTADGYAAAVGQLLDAIGWPPSTLFGTGAGAVVALALAARVPSRFPRVVVTRVPAAELRPMLFRAEPLPSGAHLAEAWHLVRRSYQFDPWWAANADARLTGGLPTARTLHAQATELLARPRGWTALATAVSHPAATTPAGAFDIGHAHVDAPTVADTIRREGSAASPPTGGFSPAAPQPAARADEVTRSYVDTAAGQVHVRRIGIAGHPIVVLHQSPGSAGQLEPLLTEFAADHQVLAPDTPGQGGSDPTGPTTDITACAQTVSQVLDALGVHRVDVWGSHTGALIGLELAVRYPERVRALGLDGITLFPDAERDDILAHYFTGAPHVPDSYGLHLLRMWGVRLDMTLYWPWYRQDSAGTVVRALPDPTDIHAGFLDMAANPESWHVAYRAAFAYPTAARLRELAVPTLLAAGPADPLRSFTALAHRINPAVITGEHSGTASARAQRETAARYRSFFAAAATSNVDQ